jgi:hypothetical protein
VASRFGALVILALTRVQSAALRELKAKPQRMPVPAGRRFVTGALTGE